jgi:biopolymer transport protein TolR
MAFLAGGGPSHPEINVTPLIDVLLVLIIVFMVVDSMKPKQEGLPAEVPQQAQDNPQRATPFDRTIVIQVIERNGQAVPALRINQEEVGWNDLQGRLQEIFKQRAERIAFVRSENEVDFQYVADVIDTAREAGVKRVGLLTTER